MPKIIKHHAQLQTKLIKECIMIGKQNYIRMLLSKMMKLRLFSKKTNLNINQRGSVLIVIVSTIVLLSTLTAGVLNLKTSATYSELYANNQNKAYYLAESGARYAKPLVQSDIEGSVTTNIDQIHGKTFTLGNSGSFTISIDTSNSNYTLVQSSGATPGAVSSSSTASLTYKMNHAFNPIFNYALFTKDKTKLKDDAVIDSYDSTVGSYSHGSQDHSNGDIGTNKSSIEQEDDATYTGTLTTNAGVTITAESFPSGGTSLGDIELEDSDTQTLTTGTYRADEIEIEDDAILTISGDVTIHVTDEMKFKDDAQITILANSTLTIYAKDEIKFEDDFQVSSSAPRDFVIYQTKNEDIEIKDDALFYGVIHHPKGKVKIKDDAQVFGGIVAKKTDVEGESKIHFDVDLKNNPGSLGTASGVTSTVQYF